MVLVNSLRSKLLASTVAFVEQTLGLTLLPTPWQSETPLPSYLTNNYALYETPLLGTEQLLILSLRDEETSPGRLEKQLSKLEQLYTNEYIYVQENVTSYNRQRLIERKIPFIVPGRQLYLPHLGLDLREHFSTRHRPRSTLSPSAQALVLYMIYRQEAIYYPSGAADDLGYSAMTMTRAFDELEALGIGDPEDGADRYRKLRVEGDRRELWEEARDALRDPVARRLSAKFEEKAPDLCAGVSALAHYTMIAEPTRRTVALTSGEWKTLQRQGQAVEVQMQDDGVEVEVWRYNPSLLTREPVVDPLSLYLSLKDTADERVQKELHTLIERALWSVA